jgi:hypothetical protein
MEVTVVEVVVGADVGQLLLAIGRVMFALLLQSKHAGMSLLPLKPGMAKPTAQSMQVKPPGPSAAELAAFACFTRFAPWHSHVSVAGTKIEFAGQPIHFRVALTKLVPVVHDGCQAHARGSAININITELNTITGDNIV